MAVSDDEWKKFLDSTEEDPDEVETDDELEDETDDDTEGKDKKTPKKPDVDDEEELDDEEDDSDDDDSDEEEDDDKSDSYKPRLKQFIKKDGTYNLEAIEKSYVDNSKETLNVTERLTQSDENYKSLLGAIKANPEAAKLIFGEDGAKKLMSDGSIAPQKSGGGSADSNAAIENHPLLQHLKAQIDNSSRKDYNDFVEAHPDAVTDPDKAKKIGDYLKIHGQVYRAEHNGEMPSMKESLEAAYRYNGWDLETKTKEEVAAAAKKTAGTRSTPQGKKKASKKAATQGAEFFAKKLGVKLK